LNPYRSDLAGRILHAVHFKTGQIAIGFLIIVLPLSIALLNILP
jgi:uncharacterized membrane protein